MLSRVKTENRSKTKIGVNVFHGSSNRHAFLAQNVKDLIGTGYVIKCMLNEKMYRVETEERH